MIIVTFSDPEEQIVEKIKAVLAEDQEIECIPNQKSLLIQRPYQSLWDMPKKL